MNDYRRVLCVLVNSRAARTSGQCFIQCVGFWKQPKDSVFPSHLVRRTSSFSPHTPNFRQRWYLLRCIYRRYMLVCDMVWKYLGYSTLVSVLGVRCLPHNTFLLYVDHGFLHLTEPFVSRLMTGDGYYYTCTHKTYMNDYGSFWQRIVCFFAVNLRLNLRPFCFPHEKGKPVTPVLHCKHGRY